MIVGVAIERFVYRALAGTGRRHRAAGRSSWRPSASPSPARTSSACCSRRGPSSCPTAPGALRTPIHWGPTAVPLARRVAGGVGRRARARPGGRSCGSRPLGRSIKATRGNPEMARIIGIDPNRIYLVVLRHRHAALRRGRLLVRRQVLRAAGHGLQAGDLRLRRRRSWPARPRSPIRVFLVGLVIGLIEQWSTIWLEVRWSQLVVFVDPAALPRSRSRSNQRRIAARLRARPA